MQRPPECCIRCLKRILLVGVGSAFTTLDASMGDNVWLSGAVTCSLLTAHPTANCTRVRRGVFQQWPRKV